VVIDWPVSIHPGSGPLEESGACYVRRVPKATINDLSIRYEILGDGDGRTWVVMPGGRLSLDTLGIRELGVQLAERGDRVLIWDRPNTGESDVHFAGPSESAMHADVLAGLLTHLDLAPAIMSGGSAGARTSLVTAARHPEVTAGLALWWISGGVYGLMFLGNLYCKESIAAAWNGGMEAVAALPEWQDVIERNPSNRQRFLDQDPKEFIATFERWMRSFCPCDDQLKAGITEADVRRIQAPTLVFRNGSSDMNHTRATSDKVAAVLPNVTVVDPPWPDTEWIDRRAAGSVGFGRWPLLGPPMSQWADRVFG
jgi:pimeloyl-ACP methyl ester carboxylesterase